jgi:uncharacterized membrane protein YsdA (DUF1294 family)
MGYRILGWLMWNGGRWYLRRKYGWRVSGKTLTAGALVVGAIGAALVAGSRSAG